MSPAFSFVGFKYEFDTHDSLWLYPVNAAGLARQAWGTRHDGACCYRLPGPIRILNILIGLFLCRDCPIRILNVLIGLFPFVPCRLIS